MKSYVSGLQYEIFCISTIVQMELIVASPCNNQQFYIVDNDMRLNDRNRMHCYVFKASLSNTFVLFTVTHIAQQCTRRHFCAPHGNNIYANVPQCYVYAYIS